MCSFNRIRSEVYNAEVRKMRLRKALLILFVALAIVGQSAAPALAHGHSSGHNSSHSNHSSSSKSKHGSSSKGNHSSSHKKKGGGNSSSAPSYSNCNVEGCDAIEEHQHGNNHYYGHSMDDGHDYHAVCDVQGCEEMTEHVHGDASYLPHFAEDGHSYHHS